MPNNDLMITGLTKNYGLVRALNDVNFTLKDGEFLTLLGPSGSGKTTTLMAVAGFTQVESGSVQLAGLDITDLPPEDRGFGFVFQGYALFPHMTVSENLAFPLKVRGLGKADREKKIRAALSRVRLLEHAERKPKELSGGQQQRVALARAMVYQPKILLLDEPLSALDRKLRAELQWELKSLHRDLGVSFLYVTHDQEEALTMSDRVAIFQNGSIVQCGSPDQLFERPSSRFVADFFGKSNFFSAEVVGIQDAACEIRWEGGRCFLQRDYPLVAKQQINIAIRPHRLSFIEPQETGLVGTLTARTYAGHVLHCIVKTNAGTDVTVEVPAVEGYRGVPEIGCVVGLQVQPNALMALTS